MAKTKSATKDNSSAEWDDITIGDQVKHPKWGVGTVLFRSGMGEDAKAIVVFPEEGQKKLMLAFAKLKKVGTAKGAEKAKAAPEKEPKIKYSEEDEDTEDIVADGDGDDEDVPEDDDIFPDDDDKSPYVPTDKSGAE